MKKFVSYLSFYFVIMLVSANFVFGQAEMEPWGNLNGIRVQGQLMKVQSSLAVVSGDWSKIVTTAQEHQSPKYRREGNKQIVETKIDSISFTETIEDKNPGSANVNVRISSNAEIKGDGVFFRIEILLSDFTNIITGQNSGIRRYIEKGILNDGFSISTSDISFNSKLHHLKITFDKPTKVLIKKNTEATNKVAFLYIPILESGVQPNTTAEKSFTINAGGYIDNRPVAFKLNTSTQGRPFDGFGGNFRLQNPKTDPQVIDYSLKNLRVAWSRVELPWSYWQPEMNEDPIKNAEDGKLNPRVEKVMEMAARLHKMNIPIILSAWFPPQWAVVGNLNMRPVNGVGGNPLDSTKMNEIYKSITDYIIYLKNKYDVTISFFSFNESDLGINVRQTGAEHDALIKGLGAYFKSHGLTTKMLLGDNSDATTYRFIYPAMNDPEAIQYIGAISFHSWRGWDKLILEKWDSAARVLHVPLIVGEGSIDAAAWNYPEIFEEPVYAMKEINLYIRLLKICHPLSILQWQLTADYSPLAGGGIFGNNDTLHAAQRFWNFKQLSSTPKGLFAMPVTEDRPDISCAALGDNRKRIYAVHIVNNGAGRNATLTGLPLSVKTVYVYNTDKNRSVKKGASIKVTNGVAKFHLDAAAYTTLSTQVL